MTRLFVGNLSYEVTSEELHTAFARYGQVSSAVIAMDSSTGRSRGFAFIEMAGQAHAAAATQGLNGTVLKGRTINVSPAHARPQRSNRARNAPRGWGVVGDGEHRW
jgi:RNA recognition motif-containing protein